MVQEASSKLAIGAQTLSHRPSGTAGQRAHQGREIDLAGTVRGLVLAARG
jgi:hypothetical protein